MVDAIAMQALGCRLAVLAGARLDTELVHFDMPGGNRWRQFAEQASAEFEKSQQARSRHLDRLEPARDAAVQGVVVEALEVRLMRFAVSAAELGDRKHRVPPAPVAATVGHVAVERKIVPTRREPGPVAHRTDAVQGLAHHVAAHEGETRFCDHRCEPVCHGCIEAVIVLFCAF